MKTQIRYGISSDIKTTVFLIAFILLPSVSCVQELDVEPKLNTLQVSDAEIGTTTAKLKGEVLVTGNLNIIEYGIELSKSMYFTSPLNKGIPGTPAKGEFEIDFTGLEPNTQYYYKAYALVNTANIYSQNALHFTTRQ